MAQATVSFRMDDDLKKRMEIICDEMGMNLTTAFTIFAKKVTREHRIPFEVEADPYFTDKDLEYFQQCAKELREGKGIPKTLEELKAMTPEDFERERKKLTERGIDLNG